MPGIPKGTKFVLAWSPQNLHHKYYMADPDGDDVDFGIDIRIDQDYLYLYPEWFKHVTVRKRKKST